MPNSHPLRLIRNQVREEAEEERRLFIAQRDDGLNNGLHGLSQNLQAETSGAEPSSGPGYRCLCRQAGAGFLLPFNVQRDCEDLVLNPGSRSVQETAFLHLVVRVSDQRLDASNTYLPQLCQERFCQSHTDKQSLLLCEFLKEKFKLLLSI